MGRLDSGAVVNARHFSVRALAFGALLFAAAAAASFPGRASAAVEWAGDTLTTFEGVARSVDRGSIFVSEDRAKPTGSRIHLGFIRLRAIGNVSGAPLVFLSGGPGVPASFMARIPTYDRLFQKLRESGDVILLDQRGCGLSQPLLVCAPQEPLPPDVFASESLARGALERALVACTAGLRAGGVRPEAYHQRASAEDLEDLCKALGIRRIRLLAYSSGTEWAQEFLRLHGDRVERAVLVGTRAPDEAWRLPRAFDFHVRRLARIVARDSLYASRIPDFEGAIRAAVASLDAHPRVLFVADRRRDSRIELTVSGFALQLILQGDLVEPIGFAVAPALLASLAEGDYAIFDAKVEGLYNSLAGIANVELAAFDCASGADGDRIRLIEREEAASVVGGARGLLQRPSLCGQIGAADLGVDYRERVYSAVPTLFLSGSLDGNTPPYQAEEVRWGFPNGIHMVVAGGWHELLPTPDVRQAVADYLAGQDIGGRRLAVPPPRFFSIQDAKSFVRGAR